MIISIPGIVSQGGSGKKCIIFLDVTSSGNSNYASVIIDGIEYGNTAPADDIYITVNIGTVIICTVSSIHPGQKGMIYVDNNSVAETSAANVPVTYQYTVVGDIVMYVNGIAMGPTISIVQN